MPKMKPLALIAIAVLVLLGYVAAGRRLTGHQLGVSGCRASAPAYVLSNPPLDFGPIHLKAGHATNWVLWPYEYVVHVVLGKSTTSDYLNARECMPVSFRADAPRPAKKKQH